MGIAFALLFALCFLVVGALMAILGIIGVIICIRRIKSGKPRKKISIIGTVFSALSMAVGTVLILIPLSYFGFIVWVNTTPPEDYVKTDIMIEEDGYQSDKFTANGVVYKSLELYIDGEIRGFKPVFSYETSGFLNGSQCGNYYEVENPKDFPLFCDDGGKLFVPQNEYKKISQYYHNKDNYCGYLYDSNGNKKYLDDASVTQITDYVDENQATKTIIINHNNEIDLHIVSKDGIVYMDFHSFIIHKDSLYCVCISEYLGNNNTKYTVLEIPRELAEPITEAFNVK